MRQRHWKQQNLNHVTKMEHWGLFSLLIIDFWVQWPGFVIIRICSCLHLVQGEAFWKKSVKTQLFSARGTKENPYSVIMWWNNNFLNPINPFGGSLGAMRSNALNNLLTRLWLHIAGQNLCLPGIQTGVDRYWDKPGLQSGRQGKPPAGTKKKVHSWNPFNLRAYVLIILIFLCGPFPAVQLGSGACRWPCSWRTVRARVSGCGRLGRAEPDWVDCEWGFFLMNPRFLPGSF